MTITVTDGRGQRLPITSGPGPRTTPAPTEPGTGSGHRDFPTVTIGGEKVDQLERLVQTYEHRLTDGRLGSELTSFAVGSVMSGLFAGMMIMNPKVRSSGHLGAALATSGAMMLGVAGTSALAHVMTSVASAQGQSTADANRIGSGVAQIGLGGLMVGASVLLGRGRRAGVLPAVLMGAGTGSVLAGLLTRSRADLLDTLREQLHDARLGQALSG